MEVQNLLKLIKFKLFEPKKQVVLDIYGNKVFAKKEVFSAVSNVSDICDGWNVADKDYVQFKIAETLNNMQKIPIPSAPTPLVSKTMIISHGNVTEDNSILFFSPGVVLKKGWTITEILLYVTPPLAEETAVIFKQEKQQQVISKIKPNGKQLTGADLNVCIDQTKTVQVLLQTQNKKDTKIDYKTTLQLVIEI